MTRFRTPFDRFLVVLFVLFVFVVGVPTTYDAVTVAHHNDAERIGGECVANKAAARGTSTIPSSFDFAFNNECRELGEHQAESGIWAGFVNIVLTILAGLLLVGLIWTGRWAVRWIRSGEAP